MACSREHPLSRTAAVGLSEAAIEKESRYCIRFLKEEGNAEGELSS